MYLVLDHIINCILYPWNATFCSAPLICFWMYTQLMVKTNIFRVPELPHSCLCVWVYHLVFSHWLYEYITSHNLPLSNIRTASATSGTNSRLTTNPGVSLHVIVVFPRAFPHAVIFSYVSSEVSGIRITFIINLHHLLLQNFFHIAIIKHINWNTSSILKRTWEVRSITVLCDTMLLPSSIVLVEMLTVTQIAREFSTFYETQKFCYLVHKRLQLVPTVHHTNTVNILKTYLWCILILSSQPSPCFPNGLHHPELYMYFSAIQCILQVSTNKWPLISSS